MLGGAVAAFRQQGRLRGGLGWLVLLWLVLMTAAAPAEDRAQLVATAEVGYGRLVLSFADRLDLPAYKIKSDSSILSLTFDHPVTLQLPDIAATLPDYIAAARIDPDGKGLRFGLRGPFTVSHIEAGEKLFIDLLPPDWQGLPPGLPPEVVSELAERAKKAEKLAERKRKAEEAERLKPVAELRVGRNPTFFRLQFDWSAPTKGTFSFNHGTGTLRFDWPVPVDLGLLKSNLPPEIREASDDVGPDGSTVRLVFAEGVTPRFYATSDRQFIVDVDIASKWVAADTVQRLEALRRQAAADAASVKRVTKSANRPAPPAGPDNASTSAAPAAEQADQPPPAQAEITPYADLVGQTLRVVFPFDRDTPAAVFRRGDTLWMLFDTLTTIRQPAKSDAMTSLVEAFTVTPSGSTQVVRIDLSAKRLATLGSEGRAWVLSIGDQLLTPTEPITLSRRQDASGQFEVTADIERPSKVHQFRDPLVGDLLTVVTAYPPARGLTRDLGYVDFRGLRSVHGLVIKPRTDNVSVAIEGKLAVISAPGGLDVSALGSAQTRDSASPPGDRAGYVDLKAMLETDPVKLTERREQLMDFASRGEGEAHDRARLDLARFYIANRLGPEALGVLAIASGDIKDKDLEREAKRDTAIADILAYRPGDALAILDSPGFSDEADALLWRSIARTDDYNFGGARADIAAAEAVVDDYPQWVRARFRLSAARAYIETGDPEAAQAELEKVEFARLEGTDVTLYQLLAGRVAEAEGRLDEAIDTYGQVIAADDRPNRAEAIYRTLLVLDRKGTLDVAKAVDTLGAEVMVWRGDPLEADMDKLLAELYFRQGDYRDGFQTAKSAVEYYPESPPIRQLQDEARRQFTDLFLNGKADSLDPVQALAIYYDFRALTPPGTEGDQMIRNLATRLVKLDLLDKAAELLAYQVDNRLNGAARAQVAADLAVVLIADRRPQDALNVLHKTQLAQLPPSLERQRRVLEARALIDGGRNELALDMLSRLKGREVDFLRVDAHWNAHDYDQAAGLLEELYPAPEQGSMTERARMGVLKAAVGYVLANDRIGTARLRSKFADLLSQSPEWPLFDYLTRPVETDALRFKQAAHDIAGVDSLDAFLSAYDKLYASAGSIVPAAAKPAG